MNLPLRRYLAAVGSLLLLQGIAVLLLMLFSISLPSPWNRAVPPDALHATIHIVWGLLIAGALRRQKVLQIGFSFSLFYLLFGVVGILFENPWGLLLGKGENGFHLFVGSIALALVIRQVSLTRQQTLR